jgi:TetR/AcrR family transcriptional regulator of autoinduction and epiphytic fitness
MTDTAKRPGQAAEDTPRRKALLDAALAVFSRFGYRKTSMDEVAQAAGFSRQGLYFYYATKEDLFRATVLHSFTSRLDAVKAALANSRLSFQERLIAALDEWEGRYIGSLGSDAGDLIETSGLLAGPIIREYEVRFEQLLAGCLAKESPLMAAYKAIRMTPMQLAQSIHATARGFKDRSETRRDFLAHVKIAVQVLCFPMHSRVAGEIKKTNGKTIP